MSLHRRLRVAEGVTTLASGQGPYGIALDGTSVYWTRLVGTGSVMKITPK